MRHFHVKCFLMKESKLKVKKRKKKGEANLRDLRY